MQPQQPQQPLTKDQLEQQILMLEEAIKQFQANLEGLIGLEELLKDSKSSENFKKFLGFLNHTFWGENSPFYKLRPEERTPTMLTFHEGSRHVVTFINGIIKKLDYEIEMVNNKISELNKQISDVQKYMHQQSKSNVINAVDMSKKIYDPSLTPKGK